jgi:hypothetical protein
MLHTYIRTHIHTHEHTAGMLQYTPERFYNGMQTVVYTVNDQGNVGIGFPCNAPNDVPAELMFEYCKAKQPVVALQTTAGWDIRIQPVNNPPNLTLYEEDSITKKPISTSVSALQNVTRRLNRMEIFDGDIAETAGCKMRVNMVTRAGGILFFNTSLAPEMSYAPNPTLTSISAAGSMRDINIFMRNINYRSDPQFTGLETIVIDLSDSGCTGIVQGEQGVSDMCMYAVCVYMHVRFEDHCD